MFCLARVINTRDYLKLCRRQSDVNICVFFIHRPKDEYMILVSVSGSVLRSTKEGKLAYILGRDGNQLTPRVIRNSSRKLVASRIDVVNQGQLGRGSSRPESTQPGRLGQVNSACVT